MRSAKGSVTKLGNNYYRVRVTAKAVNPETGKPYRLSEYVHGTRRQAEEAKLRLLAQAGEDVVDSSATFGEFVEATYVPAKELAVRNGRFKRKTLSEYRRRLRLHVLPTFAETPLRDISPLMVSTWLAGFEKQTVALEAFKALRSVLSLAVKEMKLASNPCHRVEEPETPEYEPHALDADEIAAYLAAYRGTTVEAAVLLAVGGGFRRGEICALDVEDIDFATGDVTVDDAYLEDGGEAYSDTTKNRRLRIVSLPPSITARLREVLPGSGPVLPGRDGGRMHPSAVTRTYRRHQGELPEGVPRVPLKDLRHSSLTLAYDAGGEASAVQDRGGHGSFKTTRRYYLRPHRDRDRAIASAMDRKLGGGGETTVSYRVKASTIEAF